MILVFTLISGSLTYAFTIIHTVNFIINICRKELLTLLLQCGVKKDLVLNLLKAY